MSTRLHQSRRRTDYQAGLTENVTDSARRRGRDGGPKITSVGKATVFEG